MENTPHAVSRNAEPAVRKFAGRTNCGAAEMSVRVVDVASAVPAAVGCGELSRDSQVIPGIKAAFQLNVTVAVAVQT